MNRAARGVVWLRLLALAVVLVVALHIARSTSLTYKGIRAAFGATPSAAMASRVTPSEAKGSDGRGSTRSDAAPATPSAACATIPKILHLTYHDKANIPQKIHDDLRTFAAGYDVRIYDDADGEAMLRRHFAPEVLERFRSLRGAHKADLLRYCYLLIDGGVYIDIKTKLIMPLDQIIDHTRPGAFYTVLSTIISDTVYQGMLACPPQHPVMRDCLEFMVGLPAWVPRWYYAVFTTDMYATIRRRCGGKGRLHAGWNEAASSESSGDCRYRYYLFPTLSLFTNPEESSPYRCTDGLDRYGMCEYIVAAADPPNDEHSHEQDAPLVKLRHADFPWPKSAQAIALRSPSLGNPADAVGPPRRPSRRAAT